MWSLVLVLIESNLATRVLNCLSKLCRMNFPKPNAALVIDEDVKGEALRVENADTNDMKIRVKELRKVYMTGKGPCSRG